LPVKSFVYNDDTLFYIIDKENVNIYVSDTACQENYEVRYSVATRFYRYEPLKKE